MQQYTLKVFDIRKETSDTVTLCFKQPGLKKIKYLAGQYLTLIFRINGRRYIRPYSFSSSPAVDSLLEITVKRVPGGLVSNHINDMVKVGDTIEVLSPMGDFVFENNNEKTVYLWGVGSGITPLISLAKQILFEYEGINLKLIYGNKNEETTIFLNQIHKLKADFTTRFEPIHFFTRASIVENPPMVVFGRISKDEVKKIVSSDPYIHQSKHFICGPIGLKASVTEALLAEHINEKNIFTEDFELVKNPKDFENILTQNVEIIFQGNEYKIEVVSGKSILEAALDANIELPYSCQTGSCSTCKAKLLQGKVKMIGLTKDRNDLEQDEFLLCCTHPITADVNLVI